MMGVFWLSIILFSWTSPIRCDEKPWVCRRTENSVLSVPCSDITTKSTDNKENTTDIMFTIFRNRKEIYQLCTDPSRKNCTIKHDSVSLEEKDGKRIGFTIALKAKTDQGVYRCEVKRLYPPPLLTDKGKSVLVLREEQGCFNKTETCKKDVPEPPKPEKSVWMWILVVVLLSIYSLAVTIAACVIWYKMQDADSQNDYINTKPKAPPNRRKKRGIQHPIPKHF